MIVAVEGPAAAELLGLPPVDSNPATCVWFSADMITEPLLVLDGKGPAQHCDHEQRLTGVSAGRQGARPGAPAPACSPPTPARRSEQLRDVWGTQVDRWIHLRTDAIPHGQPSQPPSFPPKQRTALGDGLHVCGDHRDTSSIQGALYRSSLRQETILAG